MQGRRDIDRQESWFNEYQGKYYTNKSIKFINIVKDYGFLIDDDIPQNMKYINFDV